MFTCTKLYKVLTFHLLITNIYASNCFVSQITPGCDNTCCMDLVCAQDPYCCNNNWDSTCVYEVGLFCPSTCFPTDPPTDPPTNPPTNSPTNPPTDAPTNPPTDAPTNPPTDAPTNPPTDPPTDTDNSNSQLGDLNAKSTANISTMNLVTYVLILLSLVFN